MGGVTNVVMLDQKKNSFLKEFLPVALVMAGCLFWLTRDVFLKPGHIMFSNDGPFGTMASEQARIPEAVSALWEDLEYVGKPGIAFGGYGGLSMSLLVWSRWPALQLLTLVLPLWLLAWFWFCGVRLATLWFWSWLVITVIFAILSLLYIVGGLAGWFNPYTTPLQMIYPLATLWLAVTMIYCLETIDPYRYP